MKIALVSPLFETVPPALYGGTERVIATLADELVGKGHEVTLFASAGSKTKARLETMTAAPLRLTMNRAELEEIAPHLHLRMLSEVYGRAEDFDIVHAHTDLWTLPFLTNASVPTVLTLHGRLDLDVVQRIFPLYPDTPLISISDSQREALDHFPIRWVATCHNGLDLSAYLRTPKRNDGYLAFVGRVTPEKRPDWAVEVARLAGMPIKIAAKIDPVDVDYWHDEIEGLMAADHVEFIGEISEADKPKFFANAAATVFPIDWPEPFGLVMIESLAAGTPVIALRNGAVPEVIDEGTTGFICDSLQGMADATLDIDGISSEACRRAARRFDGAAMAARYVDAYQRVIGERVIDRQRAKRPAPRNPVIDLMERDQTGTPRPRASRTVHR